MEMCFSKSSVKSVFTAPTKVTYPLSTFAWMSLVMIISYLFVPEESCAATYYVSTSGSDSNSGTSLATPFRTVKKGLSTAVAGDTVYIRGGIYREQADIGSGGGTATNPVKVQNYNGEDVYMKGSEVVTGWVQHSGNIWKRTNWTVNSQQVFVDFNDANPTSGPKPLKQIGKPSSYYTSWEYPAPLGSGLSSMSAGTFYYESGSQTLYVWLADGSSPNNHKMEVSTKRRLLFLARPYFLIDGLKFRHSNVSGFSQQGAAIELSTGSHITNCDVQFTDFAGVSTGWRQSNAQITKCNLSNNGNSGVLSSESNNFRVAGNTMYNNNYRNFNQLWHAGGFKGATKAYGTVESNIVANNNGSGIWFDYANSGNPIVIRNNYVYNNGPKDSAIFFEVSKNALIYNNVIVNNTRRGIYCSACDNTKILNNTIVNTSGYAAVELGGMPRSGATLTNNQLSNNIILNSTTTYDIIVMKSNGSSIVNNSSNYNAIYRAAGGLKLYNGSLYGDLASWRAATGNDSASMNANPQLANIASTSAPTNFKPIVGSAVVGKGYNFGSGVVSHDFSGTLRPSGSGYTIGAFEPGGTVSVPNPIPTSTSTPFPTPPPATTPAPTATPLVSQTPTPVIGSTLASPVGVSVSAATKIIDNKGDVWTLSSSGEVYRNGAKAGYTENVVRIYWDGSAVYQQINTGLWWFWNGTGWTLTNSPVSGQ